MSQPTDRRAEILETAAALFASRGLQTTLGEIASACHILPGSLYHHFESKEAVVIELVERFNDDLDRIAKDGIEALHAPAATPFAERIVTFCRSIAECGGRHRAALLLTLYEPPTVLGDELARLAAQLYVALDEAMLAILESGLAAGALRRGIPLDLLADRLRQSMLHVGIGVSHLTPGGEHVPEIRCRILLHGLAVRPPTDGALSRSAAIGAARRAVSSWNVARPGDDRAADLQQVARAEFGRRGYEATTMRDIATAAGISTGSLYRLFPSKTDLLVSVMSSYASQYTEAWDDVLRTASSPLEKVDALMWVNINLQDRFADEFKISLAWLRQSPPSASDLGLSFSTQLRQLRSLLAEGTRAGDIGLTGASADVRARCLLETIHMPETIVQRAGTRGAQSLARDTVLRGALAR
jgi:AcrR family transcriptional regulator